MYTLFSPESNTRKRSNEWEQKIKLKRRETNEEKQNDAIEWFFCVKDCKDKNDETEMIKVDKIHVIVDLLQAVC